MKKLMFAAAALAAGIAMADVKSANVVGYLHNDTEELGNVARGACFATVSATKTFTLADLKVTGYGSDGCSGKFVIQKLETDGSALTSNCYYWWDDANHVAGWYNRTGKTKIEEEKVGFNQGQGFWTDGKGYKLVSSGQVTTDTILCDTEELGNVMITQATPVALALKDVTVTGYPDTGCSGKFVVQKLETDGSALTANCYYWWDDANHAAGWYNRTGKTALDADEIPLPAGSAYWVDGKGYKLVLPKVDIN